MVAHRYTQMWEGKTFICIKFKREKKKGKGQRGRDQKKGSRWTRTKARARLSFFLKKYHCNKKRKVETWCLTIGTSKLQCNQEVGASPRKAAGEPGQSRQEIPEQQTPPRKELSPGWGTSQGEFWVLLSLKTAKGFIPRAAVRWQPQDW